MMKGGVKMKWKDFASKEEILKNEEIKKMNEEKERVYIMKNYNEVLGDMVKKIKNNRVTYNEQVEAIKTDEKLTSEGKSETLSEQFESYNKKHIRLMDELEGIKITAKDELQTNVFSLDNKKNMPAYNAAIDKAEKVAEKGNDALNNLLERFNRMDDEVSQLGVAHIAAEKGFHGVLDNYKKLNPGRAKAFDALREFEAAWGDNRSMETKFAHKISTAGPRRDEEANN